MDRCDSEQLERCLQGFEPSAVQQRVAGACPAGHYITAVGADGSVTWAPTASESATSPTWWRA
jgi:hypothetical protein